MAADTFAVTFTDRSDVEAALRDAALVPPPPAASLQPGATADLRQAMARFSGGAGHAARRHAIDVEVAAVDAALLGDAAAQRTTGRLDGRRVDAVADIAFRAPTEAMALELGIDEADLAGVVADTAAMVRVIGRGEPSTAASDGAVTRLLARLGGSVAKVSLLYQNHDATAALILASIVAQDSGQPRRAAVVRTVRVAASDTSVGPTPVAAGTTVALDLESSGFEFGAGHHMCPGRALAESIAAAVVSTIDLAGYAVVRPEATFDDAGRPAFLPLEPAR